MARLVNAYSYFCRFPAYVRTQFAYPFVLVTLSPPLQLIRSLTQEASGWPKGLFPAIQYWSSSARSWADRSEDCKPVRDTLEQSGEPRYVELGCIMARTPGRFALREDHS